jgi:hypothetical protein
MKFFEKYYESVDFLGKDRVKVSCPFHNDTVASAIINVHDNSFHCFGCDEHYTEQQFVAKINGVEPSQAGRVLATLEENTHDWTLIEKAELWANNALLQKTRALGLSDDTIDKLHLGLVKDAHHNVLLGFPVFYNNALLDVRKYNIAKIPNIPKTQSNAGVEVGYVIPYDLWLKDKSKTYIFEGEKDMAIAQELGLNAITLTGGASAKPNDLVLGAFKDREIVICYDNDEPGVEGAKALFNELKGVAKSVKYIDISEVVKEEKQDFYDAVRVYGMDIFTFLSLPERDFDDVEDVDSFIPLQKALQNNRIRQKIKSKVTISADFSDTYAVPLSVQFTKGASNGKNDIMLVGETRTWYLDKNRMKQILDLIEVGAKEIDVMNTIRTWVNIPSSEKGIQSRVSEYQTVYKVRIMDSSSVVVVSQEDEFNQVTLDLYSFNSLNVGAQYIINYVIYPHPTKHQKLVAVAMSSEEIDAGSQFKVKPDILKHFQKEGTIDERIHYLYESAKHHIAKHLNFDLWLMSDLVFNSVLQFDYTDRIRGALDVFILGDTQVGKSETSSKLTELYNFGHFLSLKTSTTVGLIGGSHKVDNSMLNTIGAIPRQHKKLVVLEEFSGAKPDFIKTMTDIRSSGRIRITRVAGELNVPCQLRMITISNPVNDDLGNPRYLSTFPNGVSPLMELIKSAEDVARYDAFLLVSKVQTRFNPFSFKLVGEPIAKEYYPYKAQWVYTRKAEDVIIDDETASYIWEQADILNKTFESNFPLFGTTTPLKLARFSVALASLIVSTSDDYSKVRVTKDIVDYIVTYFHKIYDNEVFKLKDYREEYESYNHASPQEIKELEQMYIKNSVMLDFLMTVSNTTNINLRTISGLDGDKYNPVFSNLVKMRFLKLSGQSVFPTPKLRVAMSKINKTISTNTGTIKIDEPTSLTYKIE